MVQMTSFEDRALQLTIRGIPVAPIPARTKGSDLKNWENLATTDQSVISEWAKGKYADGNTAAVAKAQPGGTFFLEIDKPNFHKEIQEQTGQTLPQTFMVSSRPGEGRGHLYFRHTPETIALAQQVGKAYISGKDENGKEAWSLRWNNAYVVGPLSVHPDTGKLYEIKKDVEIAAGPAWLAHWCVDNQGEIKKIEQEDLSPIAEGTRDATLTSIAGRARQVMKMDKEELFTYLSSVNVKRCRPPLPEKDIWKIANSIGKKAIQDNTPTPVPFSYSKDAPPVVRPDIKTAPYPKFPDWVMDGTSLGDGLARPICAENNSYPEFIFMPAMLMMMNYMAFKVEIKDRKLIPNMYMALIGAPEVTFKTTGVKQAVAYLQPIGMVDYANGSKAEGKSLIVEAGSTEGLGLMMKETTCRNVILWYDEFETFVTKATIDRSSMMGHLLSIYDASMFSNRKSSKREFFTHPANEYCGSFIACCPDETFTELWAKLPNSGDSGWKSRFFFVLQPEEFKDITGEVYVDTANGAVLTRKRMNAAMQQKTFEITNPQMIAAKIKELGLKPRYIKLVEKMALYFAIDRGFTEIEESCIERAVALVKYGMEVKNYFPTYESKNKEASLQQKITNKLMQKGGSMGLRDLETALHKKRHGTTEWYRAFQGLIIDGQVQVVGKGEKGDQKEVILLQEL